MKKVLTWLGIAFLIFFIAFNPHSAARVFGSLGRTIGSAARGFGTFFGDLAKYLPGEMHLALAHLDGSLHATITCLLYLVG